MHSKRSLIFALFENMHDPSGYYRSVEQLSAGEALFYDDVIKSWVVTSLECALEVLNDARFIRMPPDVCSLSAREIIEAQFIYQDNMGPRKAWSEYIQTRTAVCRDEIKTIARQYARNITSQVVADIFVDVLRPYVSECVFCLLGLRATERDPIMEAVQKYVYYLDGKALSLADASASFDALESLYRLLGEVLPTARDVNTAGRSSFIANAALVLAAGHESTAFALGTVLVESQRMIGTAWPLAWDDDYSRLFREVLRFDSPVQLIGRSANDDMKVGGALVAKGEKILVHVGAANRDPAFFDLPERLLPSRTTRNAISFGAGKARCPGAGFAFSIFEAFLAQLSETDMQIVIDNTKVRYSSGIAGREFFQIPASIHASSPK